MYVPPFDSILSYPRICGHRGFSAAMPENSWNGREGGDGLVERAIACGANKVQFDREHIDAAAR